MILRYLYLNLVWAEQVKLLTYQSFKYKYIFAMLSFLGIQINRCLGTN